MSGRACNPTRVADRRLSHRRRLQPGGWRSNPRQATATASSAPRDTAPPTTGRHRASRRRRSSTSPSSTSTSSTTTTVPGLDVYDPDCVVQVEPGDSLGAIASAEADEIITIASLQAENGLPDELIVPDQLLDVCIDNGLDDITGEQRLERNAAVLAAETIVSVTAQQTKLNELLVPYGFPEMPVDGVSGPVTRRALCASRLALGLPVNRADMAPGSDEELLLLATTELPIPAERRHRGSMDLHRSHLPDPADRRGPRPHGQHLPHLDRRARLRDPAAGAHQGVPIRPGPRQRRLARVDRLSRCRRTTRSTATCTSRCTSTTARRSTVPTTCRPARRARDAPA